MAHAATGRADAAEHGHAGPDRASRPGGPDAAALAWQDVTDATGGDGVLLTIRQSKTNQDGDAGDVRFLKNDAAMAVRALRAARSGDLAALVVDRLDEIAVRIRSGNTDDWRQYWNENAYGQPTGPKPENSCRNALLSDLQQCLLTDVDAHREGPYANDKRADTRIAYQDFNVPVEIKRNGHPNLWRAIRDQLVVQYARDLGADGYGIYLVLWFGEIDGCRTARSPTGARPADPDALKRSLEATLAPDQARKISVRVIDVSAPDT